MAMFLEITLIKSPIGRPPAHRQTVKTLGLTRLNKTVRHRETPAILGMVRQVSHLLSVKQVPEGEADATE
ncbi:MAG: 50S ribosomal protein L30 [Desulfobaccales bacterium]|nr:50S ribosomal protein L30 [Desulfobaccales bacterium]